MPQLVPFYIIKQVTFALLIIHSLFKENCLFTKFNLLVWYVYYFLSYDTKLTFLLNSFIVYLIWDTPYLSKYILFVFLLNLICIYAYINFVNIKLLSEYTRLKFIINLLLIISILGLFLTLFSIISRDIIKIYNLYTKRNKEHDQDYDHDHDSDEDGENGPQPGPPNPGPSSPIYSTRKRRKKTQNNVESHDEVNEEEKEVSTGYNLTKDHYESMDPAERLRLEEEYEAVKQAERLRLDAVIREADLKEAERLEEMIIEFQKKEERLKAEAKKWDADSDEFKAQLWPFYEEKEVKHLKEVIEKYKEQQKKHEVNPHQVFENAGIKTAKWSKLEGRISDLNKRLEQAENSRVIKEAQLEALREEYFEEHAQGNLEGDSSDWE